MLSTIASFGAGERIQILLIGLLAASTEETVFRGYLQSAVMARIGFSRGLVATALVFMIYHLPMGLDPINLAAKFVSGLVLGGLRGRSRSLLAPATAHFLFWQIFGFA